MDATKEALLDYLQRGRDAVIWKLDGLTPYDARRPMVPTGTNLLGLVKHLASCEFGYFGVAFGRPPAGAPAWLLSNDLDADPNIDMYATAEESVEEIVALYRAAWAHSDATITDLPLDTEGLVPWWPEGRQKITLSEALARLISETHRHAGHADLVRELIDGTAGWAAKSSQLPEHDPSEWREYTEKLERIAREATG